jgi:hypothetical protein
MLSGTLLSGVITAEPLSETESVFALVKRGEAELHLVTLSADGPVLGALPAPNGCTQKVEPWSLRTLAVTGLT